MRLKNTLAAALTALAVATAITAPAAYARPVVDPPAPSVTCDPSAVPPPPSSIAASAAKQYELLRECGAQDHSTTVASVPVTREAPPTSFDWVSATIGAIVATGSLLAFAAATGMRRRVDRSRRPALSR